MTDKNAVIYCRVSTREQVEDGNSLVTQERLCREYAISNGFEVAHIFIERGESAKTATRTELQKLLTFCDEKKNQVNAVIVYKIDRLSRNTDDYGQIRILLKRRNIEIRSTSESFENTPAGRFMENIIANVAQFDNDVRTERSIGGSKEAMREGRYVWRAPYGYVNAKVGGKSTIIPSDKAQLVTEAFLEVAQNYTTVSDVYASLVKKGLLNKQGKPFSQGHFYDLLRNRVYAGWIIKFKESHRGLFSPLVSEEVFAHVQRIICRKKQSAKLYLTNNPDFPLRKFIRHPSGLRLTGCWAKGRSNRYPYYFFRNKQGNFKRDELEEIFKNFLDSYSFSTHRIKRLKQFLIEKYRKTIEQLEKEYEHNKMQIDEIKKKQSFLIQKSIDGVIQDNFLKEQLEELDRIMMQLTSSKIAHENPKKYDWEQILEGVTDFLKNPGTAWKNCDFEEKVLLQRFYFPNGVVFDGENCRTDKVCSLFKLKTDFYTIDSASVTNRFKKSNTPKSVTSPSDFKNRYHLDDQFWNVIMHELLYINNIRNKKLEIASC